MWNLLWGILGSPYQITSHLHDYNKSPPVNDAAPQLNHNLLVHI